MRLLLIEFYPGALRRNEKSMLFPFLKGLSAAKGCETLWLCFGGALAPASEGYGGRMLRAELLGEDLRALGRHLESFRPTHVVTSDLVSATIEARLFSATPPPEHLVMPTMSDMAFGAPGASGMKTTRSLMSGDPARHDYLAHCGWFLDWLGVPDPELARRPLVNDVVPDYATVVANASAASQRSAISIVSGAICGNRMRLADNRAFAGVDLGPLGEHLGCSFCMSATIPPYTPPGSDLLALWELQFRRIEETAGRGGRNRGLFEFFDYRAFRRIDEVAELVLRIGLPPSVFLFNPRIDDILNARERMERALPALASAGHEVRILSMGVENFSEAENERLNKGISLAQVDAFLALARRWESTHPGVFMPFKAGGEQIELGFILYTPWTTFADLRTNLDAATARHFSPTGYWLYSTLDIQPMEPMYRLAQQSGDVLVERFPDRGQYYGVFLNETEVGHLSPWRFRDAKVADYFAMVVRVSAAEREGEGCAFFQEDAEFARIERAYREAKARAKLTPLAVARALLDVFEASMGAAPRMALFEEALARVAGPTAPAPAPWPAAAVVARVLETLNQPGGAAFPGIALRRVEEIGPPDARRIRLAVSVAGRDLVLDLLDARSDGPCFVRSRHFRAVYHKDTPVTSPALRDRVATLLRLFDKHVDAT